jgi:hypothetical protein
LQVDGEAWGVDGDVLLDEDGNPEIDENEVLNGAGDDNEGGWDVSDHSTTIKETLIYFRLTPTLLFLPTSRQFALETNRTRLLKIFNFSNIII